MCVYLLGVGGAAVSLMEEGAKEGKCARTPQSHNAADMASPAD